MASKKKTREFAQQYAQTERKGCSLVGWIALKYSCTASAAITYLKRAGLNPVTGEKHPEIQGEKRPSRGPTGEKEELLPDEFNLKTATYVMFKPCPFCGANAGPVMDFVNDSSPFSDKPIYQSRIDCANSKCGASVFVNTLDRAESQRLVVEKWQRRPC
jgi:hypothetical protein